jgi:hypothetical protein
MLTPMAKSGGTRKAAEEPRRAMRARAVSEMLPEIGGNAFRRFGFVQSSIVSRWREIVGDRYAGVSAPESIRFPWAASRTACSPSSLRAPTRR